MCLAEDTRRWANTNWSKTGSDDLRVKITRPYKSAEEYRGCPPTIVFQTLASTIQNTRSELFHRGRLPCRLKMAIVAQREVLWDELLVTSRAEPKHSK
jgi:hypothetical protein